MASPAEIAGFVGAAAWLPQVATWVYKAATRPTLTVLPDATAEIGFTTLGPIFNLRLAMAVDRKDVVLTKLGIKLVHENGDHHEFSWRGMTETVSSIRDKSGIQQGVFEREHPAIALKVATAGLVVQHFRFQEDRFEEDVAPVREAAVKHLDFLRDNGGSYQDEFLRSEKLKELLDSSKEHFWWQAGKYRVTFSVESIQKPRLVRDAFAFCLKKPDVDFLKHNLQVLKDHYEWSVKLRMPGFDKQGPVFGFRYPSVDKE